MPKKTVDIYELAEMIKSEVNKLGKVTPLNPAYKYFKRAVLGKKVILKPDTVLYRARIVIPSKDNNIDDEELTENGFEDDGFEDETDKDEIEQGEPENDETESLDSKEGIKELDGESGDDEEDINFVLEKEEKNELEKTEVEAEKLTDQEFAKDEIGIEKVFASKEENENEKIVTDADKPYNKLSKLLFAAREPLTAVAEYRKLAMTECILDELHLTAKKKIADFTTINGSDTRVHSMLNNYLSLYFSMYLFDINSNFYKTARYILEYILNSKFDGIAYRNNYDRKINYIFFSPRGMMMGASKSMIIQPPPRLDED